MEVGWPHGSDPKPANRHRDGSTAALTSVAITAIRAVGTTLTATLNPVTPSLPPPTTKEQGQSGVFRPLRRAGENEEPCARRGHSEPVPNDYS